MFVYKEVSIAPVTIVTIVTSNNSNNKNKKVFISYYIIIYIYYNIINNYFIDSS